MTVWELIQELTADYIDPSSEVEVMTTEGWLYEKVTEVTSVQFGGRSVVRIEALD